MAEGRDSTKVCLWGDVGCRNGVEMRWEGEKDKCIRL